MTKKNSKEFSVTYKVLVEWTQYSEKYRVLVLVDEPSDISEPLYAYQYYSGPNWKTLSHDEQEIVDVLGTAILSECLVVKGVKR